MCGIVGVFSLNGRELPDGGDVARRMASAILHRGPDDSGVEAFPEGALGHRRLSILDLSPCGHQPMYTQDSERRYCLVYNGEIYNYRELREELSRQDDYVFRSDCDTEVLAALYAKHGHKMLDKLNGLFSFAIWDSKEKRLFLATDRFAIKQLYYTVIDGRFMFASEVKALLAAGVPPEVDAVKLLEFQIMHRTYGDETLFKGISRLTPGSFLQIDQSRDAIVARRWYAIEERLSNVSEGGGTVGKRAIVDRSLQLLRKSVRRRLLSDAPLGVMCSGGIDSSLITALAANEKPNVVAYTAAIPDGDRNEMQPAARVCRHLGIPQRVFELKSDFYVSELPQAIFQNDTPLTFSNSIPMYGVCKLAQTDGVKVLLTGEGADEVFGGYTKYSIFKRFCVFERLLRAVRSCSRTFRLAMQERRFIDVCRITGNGEFYSERQALRALPGFDARLKLEEGLFCRLGCVRAESQRRVLSFMLADLYDYLSALLLRQDRMGMWAAIESRVPYLDHELVEFALTIPLSLKVGLSSGKFVLRHAARALLPAAVVNRKKRGFKGPRWGKVRAEIFKQGFVWRAMGYRPRFLESSDSTIRIERCNWTLLNIELWGRMFFWGASPEELAGEYLLSG